MRNTLLKPSNKPANMSRIAPSEVFEAEELLREVESWSKEEVESLTKLYQRKATEYRGLTQDGQE